MISVATTLVLMFPNEKPQYIPGELIYDKLDPLAVGIRMPPNEGVDEPNDWMFLRDNLAWALNNRGKVIGYDVKLYNDGYKTKATLNNGEESIDLYFSTAVAKVFLRRTYKEVPAHDEQGIVDLELERFLSNAIDLSE